MKNYDGRKEPNGVIYVLTNPSFPEYVKIGYADNLERRLKQFNNSACLPFAFRVYCVYEVEGRLRDKDVHNAVVLEEVAKMAYRTELIHPQVAPAPQELQDKHYFRKHGANAYYGQN